MLIIPVIKKGVMAFFIVFSFILVAFASADEHQKKMEELRSEVQELRQQYQEKGKELIEMEERLKALEKMIPALEQKIEIDSVTGPTVARILPDFSFIGDIRGKFGESPNNFQLEEIEIALGGFLYPQIRFDAFPAFHYEDGKYEVELEEGYLSFLNLGHGFGGQVGKKLIGFGKINPVHTHRWNFVDRPLVLTEYLGDHGLVGNGVNLNWLLPLPRFVQLEVGAWRVATPDEHGGSEPEMASPADKTYTGRVWTSFPFKNDAELEVGFSALKGLGSHHREHLDKIKVYGMDLTYKRPGPGYRRLLLRNEIMHNRRQIPEGEQRRWGFYQEVNWRWDKDWNISGRYDWVEPPFPKEVRKGREQVLLALTRSLTEATKVRIQVSHDLENEFIGYLQFIFGIGPHSHPLE